MISIAALALALTTVAPDLDPAVAERAAEATACHTKGNRLIVADLSRPSIDRRLWLFDISKPENPRLVVESQVTHGIGSDPRNTGNVQEFGNSIDSNRSSVGAFEIGPQFTAETGKPGFGLRGLDPTNDQAEARHVVIHPAAYVTGSGKPGMSAGCPAVPQSVFARFQDSHIEGGLLWIDGGSKTPADMASRSCPAALAYRATQDLARYASLNLGGVSWVF